MRSCCPRSIRSPGRSTCAATDVAHTPVALAYAIVDADGTADLFVAPDKMSEDVAQHLGNAVRVHDRAATSPTRWASMPASASPPIPSARSPRSSTRWRRAARRCCRCAIPSCWPRRSRTRPRSPATAPPRRATAPRWPASCAGVEIEAAQGRPDRIVRRRQAAGIPRGDRRAAQGHVVRHDLRDRRQRRQPALPGHRGIERCRSSSASSIWSIRAGNMPTAPPT